MFSNRPDGLPGSTKPVVARPMAPDERALRSIVPALVLLATAFAFRGVLQNGLVNWDDEQNLVTNTAYQTLTWDSLRWMFTATHGGHYQPLSWLSFAIDHELWGVSAFGFHLTNLLLHLFAVVGFYLVAVELLAAALGRRVPRAIAIGAGAAAIVFAVHPLRVESVAWATERRDVLSGALLMPAVYLYLRAVRVGIGGKRKRYVAASLVLYVLSLAAKASAMTLPIVLLLLDGYPLRRLNRDSLAETGTHSAGRAIAMEKLLYTIPASLIALIAFSAQRSSGALWHLTEHPLPLRVAQACYGLMFYLAKTVWPVGLIPLYEQPPDDYATRPIYLACAAAVVAITVLVWVTRRRWPSLAVSWAVYVVFLLPVLGLAQSGPQLVADRYTYFACLPWAVLLGGIVARMWGATASRRARARGLVAVAVLGAAAALTYMTSAQVRVWQDSYTLWTEVVSRAPQSGLGHANLAAVLNGRQEFEQARTHAQTALDILPGNRTAHLQLAYAAAALDDLDAAERHYRVGLDIAEHLGQPDTATMTSLAHVLVRMEQWREAEELLRALVEA